MSRELIKSYIKSDFDIDWFSGTGAGGQHRNKHQNCVRITHKDSGITVTGQNHKSRQANFREAFTNLAHRVKEYDNPTIDKERAPSTEVIRTYNIPDNRVIDHRTGQKDSYMGFDLQEFIEGALATEKEIE